MASLAARFEDSSSVFHFEISSNSGSHGKKRARASEGISQTRLKKSKHQHAFLSLSVLAPRSSYRPSSPREPETPLCFASSTALKPSKMCPKVYSWIDESAARWNVGYTLAQEFALWCTSDAVDKSAKRHSMIDLPLALDAPEKESRIRSISCPPLSVYTSKPGYTEQTPASLRAQLINALRLRYQECGLIRPSGSTFRKTVMCNAWIKHSFHFQHRILQRTPCQPKVMQNATGSKSHPIAQHLMGDTSEKKKANTETQNAPSPRGKSQIFNHPSRQGSRFTSQQDTSQQQILRPEAIRGELVQSRPKPKLRSSANKLRRITRSSQDITCQS